MVEVTGIDGLKGDQHKVRMVGFVDVVGWVCLGRDVVDFVGFGERQP